MVSFFVRIFNTKAICKIFIIFVVGFISRFLVNYIFDINVFKDFTSVVSLLYYGGFACFLYFLEPLIDYVYYYKMPLGGPGPVYPSDNKLSNVLFMNNNDSNTQDTSSQGLIVNNNNSNTQNTSSQGLIVDNDPTKLYDLERRVANNDHLNDKKKQK